MAPPAPTARYDYFSVSVAYEPEELIETFGKVLSAEPRTRRAFNGYTHAVGLHVSDEPEVTVQWTDKDRPNILADGYPSQKIFEITRDRFPLYGLARGDVAVDFDTSDWFEVLHAAMRTLSHEKGVRHSIIGDWETPGSPRGRTTESGARSGRRYRRLYEFAKHHGYGMPVRYEFECKPDSKHKHRYAGLSAVELLSTDSYSVELLRRIGVTLDRLTINAIEQAKPNAWWIHFVRQYGPKLIAFVGAELGGDFAQLETRIKAELSQRDRFTHAVADNSESPEVFRERGC